MRGFSLLEALLALMILSLVVVSSLGFLTEINDVVRVQGDVTEASEDLRNCVALVVRQIRMAGAGGLPLSAPRPEGGFRPLAVDVVDGFSEGQGMESSAGGEAWAFEPGRYPIEGTDVLRIRGVMTTPVFGLAANDFDGRGRCSVQSISPWTGHDQDLSISGSTCGRPFLFALQAPFTISVGNGQSRDIAQWRVVEISDEAVIENYGGASRLNLNFDDGPSAAFASLNAARAFTVKPAEVFAGGFLDDFVFLISKNGFGGSSLYRLRVTSGGGGRVLAEEMVANVVDLQVALGCDLDADGQVSEEEWFLSRGRTAGPTGDQMAELIQLRLSIAIRTQQPDRRWSEKPKSLENGPSYTAGGPGCRHRTMTVRIRPRKAAAGERRIR
ncbi:MAG: hypothetical protein DRJ65_13695 [Acidobacteria bacterium]|nr:MAG: hypothetical protein DRJ65_13695 [Acidobacteriota bacterium]